MTAVDVEVPRRYRFAPRDRAGVLLGLNVMQCAAVGVGMLGAGAALQLSGSIVLALVPVAVTGGLAFARWAGRPLHEWLPAVVGWVHLVGRGARQWRITVPTRARAQVRVALPDAFEGLGLLEAAQPGGAPTVQGIGLIVDHQAGTLSGTLRVRGREFTLLERADQERVLDAWGSALAGFCRERGAVRRVSWSEWSAPASLDEHLAFLREYHRGADATELADYIELVAESGPLTTAHDVLVTVTVDRSRVSRRASSPGADPAVEVLLQEIGLFARRLDHAGLLVEGPLSPGELALVLRLRCDPSCARRLGRRAETLGEATGVVSMHNWHPAALSVTWGGVRVDQSWHRSFWIAEWPRLEVPADWMAPLVLHSGGVRTVTVVYEPVAPSRSRRAVDRDATRLASDEDQRTRHGFRIRAQHRRAEADVLARETELVAGYPELAYAGFVTITAPAPEVLEAQTGEWEQVAAQVGLELRALDGQHDLGLLTALPVGRAPAMRRFGS